MTPPFLQEPVDRDWRQLEAIAAGYPALETVFGPVNCFAQGPTPSVIYLEIHPFEPLDALRKAMIATGLFAPSPHQHFVPHMTIMERLSAIDVSRVLMTEIESLAPGGSFHCNHLACLRPDDRFHFTPVRQIALGARAQRE